MAKFRVAICGGGIAGLVTAVALGRSLADIDVDIYEAAAGFTEIGSGIGTWSRVWKLLFSLGLREELERISGMEHSTDRLVNSIVLRKADQPEGLDFHILQTRGAVIHYYRPDLLQILLNHLPKHYKTHAGHRLQSYTEDASGTVTLAFENGASATCDVLLGSDGIKSTVRRTLLNARARKAEEEGSPELAKELLDKIDPIWTGIVADRVMVPMTALQAYENSHPELKMRWTDPDTLPVMHFGKRSWVIAYPVAKGRYVNMGSYEQLEKTPGKPWKGSWVENVDKAELQARHAGWDDEFRALVQCIESKASRWAIHESQPLDSWIFGRVALVGDSAHGMTPFQSAGGGQAIEDAVMIATLLGHPKALKENIPDVLKIYDKIRRSVGEHAARTSTINGQLFRLELDGISFDEHPERLGELVEALESNWNWCWTTTLDADIEIALGMLERMGD